MSWNNSAPLDYTQTVSSQSNITSSFSIFTRTLFSLKYYHQYLNKRRTNAKTISQIHTDNPYQGWKGKAPIYTPTLPSLYLPLHTIASLIYTGDGKEGLEEKSVTVKWIWRRLLPNYLVRFQIPNKKGQCNKATKKRRKLVSVCIISKREELATRQKKLLSVIKNARVSLNE